jgi:hypothetical protein
MAWSWGDVLWQRDTYESRADLRAPDAFFDQVMQTRRRPGAG